MRNSAKKYRDVLINIPPDKKALKEALNGINEMSGYMMHLFNIDFMAGAPRGVDLDYVDRPSQAQIDYQNKVAKAFEAKQKKAPGFDGAGGGVGRRSGS